MREAASRRSNVLLLEIPDPEKKMGGSCQKARKFPAAESKHEASN